MVIELKFFITVLCLRQLTQHYVTVRVSRIFYTSQKNHPFFSVFHLPSFSNIGHLKGERNNRSMMINADCSWTQTLLIHLLSASANMAKSLQFHTQKSPRTDFRNSTELISTMSYIYTLMIKAKPMKTVIQTLDNASMIHLANESR